MNIVLNKYKQVSLCLVFMMYGNCKTNENKNNDQVSNFEQILQGREEDIKRLNLQVVAGRNINSIYQNMIANNDTFNKIKEKKDAAINTEKANNKQKIINENKGNANSEIRDKIASYKNENETLKQDNKAKIRKHIENNRKLNVLKNNIKATEDLIEKVQEENAAQTAVFLEEASKKQAAEIENGKQRNDLVSEQTEENKIKIEQTETDNTKTEVDKFKLPTP